MSDVPRFQSEATRPHAILARANNSRRLYHGDDVYRQFTCVDHLILASHLTDVLFACSLLPLTEKQASREGLLCQGAPHRSVAGPALPLGNRRSNGGSIRSQAVTPAIPDNHQHGLSPHLVPHTPEGAQRLAFSATRPEASSSSKVLVGSGSRRSHSLSPRCRNGEAATNQIGSPRLLDLEATSAK